MDSRPYAGARKVHALDEGLDAGVGNDPTLRGPREAALGSRTSCSTDQELVCRLIGEVPPERPVHPLGFSAEPAELLPEHLDLISHHFRDLR